MASLLLTPAFTFFSATPGSADTAPTFTPTIAITALIASLGLVVLICIGLLLRKWILKLRAPGHFVRH